MGLHELHVCALGSLCRPELACRPQPPGIGADSLSAPLAILRLSALARGLPAIFPPVTSMPHGAGSLLLSEVGH